MIETFPQTLFVIRLVGSLLFFSGLGHYQWIRMQHGEITDAHHRLHRVLVGLGVLLWILADIEHGSWGKAVFDAVVLLLLGHRDIRLVWVKLMARRTAKTSP